MAKRGYTLGKNASIFYDHETDLKVLPGQTVQIDKNDAGQLTLLAIQNGHLVEANEPPAKAGDAKSKEK